MKNNEITELIAKREFINFYFDEGEEKSMVNILTLADWPSYPHKAIAGIYRITNIINCKSYIGQSVNIFKRLKEHKNDAFNPNAESYACSIHKKIRKYGLSNFVIEIIQTFDRQETDIANKLNDAEIFFVEKYDTFYNGYNDTLGGSQGLVYNPFDKRFNVLVDEFVNGATIYDLSIANKISEPTISCILKARGVNCCSKPKVDDSVVASLYSDGLSIKKIAKKLNVSVCCIQKSLNRTCTPRRHYKAAKSFELKMDALLENNIDRIINEYKNGSSIRTISKNTGIARDRIKRLLVINGITIQTNRSNIVCSKSVLEIDPKTNEIIATYNSIKEAADAKGLKAPSAISQICNKTYHKNKTAAGSYWKFAIN